MKVRVSQGAVGSVLPSSAPAPLRRAQPRAALSGAVVLFSFVTACGEAATAPRISDLRVEPAGVPAGETLTARVDFVDDDGDLGGGRAELSLRHVDAPEGQLFVVGLTSAGEAAKGTVTLTLRVPATEPPGPHELSVALLDATQRRSAPLVTELMILE